MGRARDPRREEAFALYQKSGGKALLKEIAETLNLPEGTIRGWKRKDKWEQKLNGTFQKIRNAPKVGAPLKNKNAVGNPGGAAPEGNQNAAIHGFYSRFIPVEEIEILKSAPGAGELERDLKVARYKLARLLQHQQLKQMQGAMGVKDGVEEYTLQDDFYESLIQKQIKLISDLEMKIHKISSESRNPAADESSVAFEFNRGGKADES